MQWEARTVWGRGRDPRVSCGGPAQGSGPADGAERSRAEGFGAELGGPGFGVESWKEHPLTGELTRAGEMSRCGARPPEASSWD